MILQEVNALIFSLQRINAETIINDAIAGASMDDLGAIEDAIEIVRARGVPEGKLSSSVFHLFSCLWLLIFFSAFHAFFTCIVLCSTQK